MDKHFDRTYKGVFSVDGRVLSTDEAKRMLLDELAKGHEVLPIVECDNFDFKKGCLGHAI